MNGTDVRTAAWLALTALAGLHDAITAEAGSEADRTHPGLFVTGMADGVQRHVLAAAVDAGAKLTVDGRYVRAVADDDAWSVTFDASAVAQPCTSTREVVEYVLPDGQRLPGLEPPC